MLGNAATRLLLFVVSEPDADSEEPEGATNRSSDVAEPIGVDAKA